MTKAEAVRVESNKWEAPSMKGKLISINISSEKGTVKTPAPQGELIADFGLKGDAHGGKWHRQVSLLALSSVDKMRAAGARVEPGDFAENLTVEGLSLHTLAVGTLLSIGDCQLEVTQIGKECHHGCAIRQQVGDCVMPREGIFAKVLVGGRISLGDSVHIL